MLALHNLGAKKKVKRRIGRGLGSGRGTYSTRGMKGQRSRSGGKKGLKLKGLRRTLLSSPKFKGMLPRYPSNQPVKISLLEKHFEPNAKITPGVLYEKKLISNLKTPVKILADKEITKPFEVFGCRISKKAEGFLTKAGGKIVEMEDAKAEKKA